MRFLGLVQKDIIGPPFSSLAAKLSSIILEYQSSSNCLSILVIQSLYSRSFDILGHLSTSCLEHCQLNQAFSTFRVSGQTVADVVVVGGVVVAAGNVALAFAASKEATVG